MEKTVNDVWTNLINSINSDSILCSNEKSLVFKFAWQLNKKYEDNINLDFERKVYGKFTGGKFLDLYAEVTQNNKTTKMGFEFKYPKKNEKGNSDQYKTRVKIINDIKRLNYLVQVRKIDYGIFLLATDEVPYTYKGDKKINPDFMTYNGKEYKKNETMPIDTKHSKEEIKLINYIKFEWLGCINKGIEKKIAWINPIFIVAVET